MPDESPKVQDDLLNPIQRVRLGGAGRIEVEVDPIVFALRTIEVLHIF